MSESGFGEMAVMVDAEGGSAPPAPQGIGKVNAVLVERAVDALVKWCAAQKQKEKAQLLEDDQLLYVVVGMKKVPDKGRTNPYVLELPHPLYQPDGNHEVCLIISDREHAKQKLDKQMAKARIEKEGLKISKVIPLSKLKTDYFAHEAKRKLCGSYDTFLADDRILGELPKLLGKTFFKKKKHPIPVNLTRAQWTGQISAALNSTYLYMSGGTCSAVKVARMSQARDEIFQNVNAVIEGIAQQIPKKWANVRSFFLKTLDSVSLPLYQSLPDMPLKIELPGLSQPEDKKSLKFSKKDKKMKAKPVEDDKVDADMSLDNDAEDKMDVIEEAAVAEKPKKRKQSAVGGKRKVPRKAAVVTGA